MKFYGDNKMTARTLQGFMELLPQEQLVFNHMKSVIAHTYEKFGFAVVSERPDIFKLKDGTKLKEFYMQKLL